MIIIRYNRSMYDIHTFVVRFSHMESSAYISDATKEFMNRKQISLPYRKSGFNRHFSIYELA
jgi:hypothetical protein